jgi:hypothetical protein
LVQSRLHFMVAEGQYPNTHSPSCVQAAPTSPPPVGKQRPMRFPLMLPTATQAFPMGQPPSYVQESTHESLAMPGVVVEAPQLTVGGLGTSKATKSMCWASLQTFTSVLAALHAHCVGA